MEAVVFPGQGAQYPGMGKNLYDQSQTIKALFQEANDILGFDIQNIMFNGIEADLKETKVTQPAVFIHSVASYLSIADDVTFQATAGHSLGEFTALVAAGVLTWQDALVLVSKRANAMQKACELQPSTMAAILGLDDDIIIETCQSITDDIVVAANFNTQGQVVISGTVTGVTKACDLLKEKGAKRALLLQVGGAFHSPLMAPASEELKEAIHSTTFLDAKFPIYQNINALGETKAEAIKINLIGQLTAPVLWTRTITNMFAEGIHQFTEAGPGKVLSSLIKKIEKESIIRHVDDIVLNKN